MKRTMCVKMAGVCVAAAMTVAFGWGCSAPVSEEPSAGEGVAIDEGTTIDFAEGSALYSQGDMVVMLDSNPTTGYEWTCEVEGDTVTVDLDKYLSAEELTADDKQAMAGEGGMHTFGFKAEGTGQAVITMKYARSWGSSSDDKTIVVTADVKDGQFAKVTSNKS